MKFARFFAFCFLGLAVFPALAQNTYSTYRNARFGTVVQYPANMLVPQREADNGDGRRFVSRDGAIELSIYGFNNINNRSANGEMQRAINDWKRDGGRLTYWKWQGNGYTLSGFVGDDIFYEKTFLRNGVFHTMIWQYPTQVRRQLDGPVTQSVRTFSAGGSATRPVSRPAPRPAKRPVPRATPKVSIEVVPNEAPRPTTNSGSTSPRKGGY